MKYEVKLHNKNISVEALLNDIKAVAIKLGKKNMGWRDYDKKGKFDSTTARSRFGTWNNALELAGLEITRRYGSSNSEFLDDLKKVALSLNKDTLKRSEYKKNGKFNDTTIASRFEGWDNALESAGLQKQKNQSRTADNLLKPINKTKSDDELHTGSKNKTLEFAGLEKVKFKKPNITNEELLTDLKRVAKELGKDSLTSEEYNESGKYYDETIKRRFGNWGKAIELAGLKKFKKHTVTEEELFENIAETWRKLERQPGANDLVKPYSKYSITPYKNTFDTWNNALKRFDEYINSPEVQTEQSIKTKSEEVEIEQTAIAVSIENETKAESKEIGVEQTVATVTEAPRKHKTSRNVNWRLRHLIMKRDKFKCVDCGGSPATDIGTILHVHHIIPWANGGETVFENLQTLCSVCNIGKSNLDFSE